VTLILLKKYYRPFLIMLLITAISLLHYNTPTMDWQFHLVYMQAYFIPILLAAFWYGIRGGLGSALMISAIYLPHIMLQWGGLVENNLMRFMQIVLFNIVGYLTGLKSQGEHEEKQRYQQTAHELEETLEQVREQSGQISEMEQQLRAADRLAIVGELTASLAHEVRNPLGSIRGAVEIIRSSVPDNLQKSEFFDILIQETERLNRVVENYLRFSSKQSDLKSIYPLQDTLNSIITMLKSTTRKNKITIETRFPTERYQVQGDPNQFWQVIINLLLNAIQAIGEKGTITIALTASEEEGNKKSGVRLSINDTGSGIEPEHLPNIFKALYSTKRSGTGLGLAIVKRIADENGWTMDVQSTPKVGTKFVIDIPTNKVSS